MVRNAKPACPPRLPAAPAVFVGREDQVNRVLAQLQRVPLAVVSGVAGVGKTSFACAVAARFSGPVVYQRVGAGQPLRSLADDARRALATGPVQEGDTDAERMEELARALDAAGALLVVDDVHALEPSDLDALVDQAGTLHRGRLLCTSRERLSKRRGPDRIELRLDGLDPVSARALWTALDDLLGPSDGFERVWRRSQGNPLLLRRGHAGELDADDPVVATVAALSPDELRVAGLLALATARLPVAGLSGARATVEALLRKMVAESDAGGLSMHDTFRAAVQARLDEETRRALHAELADLVGAADLDPVMRCREVAAHLRAAGRDQAAGEYLVAHGAEFIRHGAAHELLRAYDAVSPAARSPRIAIARARTLARALDLGAACHDLERLATAGVDDVELDLALAQSAMMTARLALAARAIARAFARRDLTPTQWVRAHTMQAMVLCHAGRGDDARGRLRDADPQAALPQHRAHLALTHAFTLWVDEQPASAEGLFAQAEALYAGASSYQSVALALPLLAALLARLGHTDEARRAMSQADQVMALRPQDRLLVADVRFLRAGFRLDLGEPMQALEAFAACERSFAALGHRLGELMTRAWRGRTLLMLGRTAEGRALLDAADAEATRLELPSVRALVTRSRVRAAGGVLVLDGLAHELRHAGGTIPLQRRPTLRRLLYALADHPASKTALAERLYGGAYKPSTHDNALWMNVTRLRKLIEPAGLRIEASDGDYRLIAPPDFVFIPDA